MKHKNDIQKLRTMQIEELERHLDDLRRALFSLRLNAVTSHVKDVSQFKKIRRMIAAGSMIYSERRHAFVMESILAHFTKEHINE